MRAVIFDLLVVLGLLFVASDKPLWSAVTLGSAVVFWLVWCDDWSRYDNRS